TTLAVCGRRARSGTITIYCPPGCRQCAAVSTRSRAIAVPVQAAPRPPTTITTWRAIASAAGSVVPTIARADAQDANTQATAVATQRMASAVRPAFVLVNTSGMAD